MTAHSVTVVIPVFNDTQEIRSVVTAILLQGPYRIIVVDDGSLLPVAPLLDGLPVTCLRHQVNLGQGAALQTGFNLALQQGAAVVVSFDADGQHDANDLPRLLEPLVAGRAAVALGSRFLAYQPNDVPRVRRWVLKTARFVNFLFCGMLLSDAHNGLRAFTKAALEKILITENRMGHASEILFEIRRHQLPFEEVPVTIYYTPYARNKGQSSGDSIKVLFDLVLLKFFR